MSELLLEIFSNEIPARMQEGACRNFKESLINNLKNIYKLTDALAISWITPRRIGVVIKNLELVSDNSTQEIRGPKSNANPEAISGFLKKYNLNQQDLFIKSDYYFVHHKTNNESPLECLKKVIIDTIKNFVWPKSMIDCNHELRWVRPIQSILCLVDGQTLNFDYFHIKSENFTFGHRFMAPDKIIVKSYEDYKSQLINAHVIIDAEDRKKIINQQISKILEGQNIKVIKDNELLSEIAGLVEYPTVFLSKINSKFMSLPKEVLIIALKHHQRYLMTEDEYGNLAPYYLIVANIVSSDEGQTLIAGNQKVLSARLSDAKFFYDQDLKKPLIDYSDQLKKLVFNANIGSIFQKQESVNIIALKLAKLFNLDAFSIERAVKLAKCDLVTSMVKEFPELQGVMGYYYAIANNESKDVAQAIRDHYKPQGPSDSLPEGAVACLVAVADKLNNLNQLFAIGVKPTSSKDPFALRRAALGTLRIIAHNEWSINYTDLDIRPDVINFIKDREAILNKSN